MWCCYLVQDSLVKEICNLSEPISWWLKVICKYAFVMVRGGKTSCRGCLKSKSETQNSNLFHARNYWIYMLFLVFCFILWQITMTRHKITDWMDGDGSPVLILSREQCVTTLAETVILYKIWFVPTLLHNLHKSTFNKPPNSMSSNHTVQGGSVWLCNLWLR